MNIERRIKRERRAAYKTLRKLRKARDAASLYTTNKTKPYRLSIIKSRYSHHADWMPISDLAFMIFEGMQRKLNPTISRPVTPKK